MKQPRQNQKTRRKRPRLPVSARSKLQDELTEVTRHRAAISEVLRAIASSPHDLQPIFDTILDSARRLCQAEVGSLRLSEQAGLRLVAVNGDLPWSPPELLEHSSYTVPSASPLPSTVASALIFLMCLSFSKPLNVCGLSSETFVSAKVMPSMFPISASGTPNSRAKNFLSNRISISTAGCREHRRSTQLHGLKRNSPVTTRDIIILGK